MQYFNSAGRAGEVTGMRPPGHRGKHVTHDLTSDCRSSLARTYR